MQPPPDSIAASRRVLVIDDDEDFSGSLLDLIEAKGFEASATADPAKAVGLAASFQPAVAIIDIHLGGVSGLDVLQRLRERQPELLCIMITAHAETQTAI